MGLIENYNLGKFRQSSFYLIHYKNWSSLRWLQQSDFEFRLGLLSKGMITKSPFDDDSSLNFWDENSFIIIIYIIYIRINILIVFLIITTFLAVVSSDFLQVLDNLLRISNRTLYLINRIDCSRSVNYVYKCLVLFLFVFFLMIAWSIQDGK